MVDKMDRLGFQDHDNCAEKKKSRHAVDSTKLLCIEYSTRDLAILFVPTRGGRGQIN